MLLDVAVGDDLKQRLQVSTSEIRLVGDKTDFCKTHSSTVFSKRTNVYFFVPQEKERGSKNSRTALTTGCKKEQNGDETQSREIL